MVYFQIIYLTGVGILLKMALTTQRSCRLLPFMTQARCRAFLLSTYQSRGDTKFTMKDIEAVKADLKKALDYLHVNNIAHGCVNESFVLIEKVK